MTLPDIDCALTNCSHSFQAKRDKFAMPSADLMAAGVRDQTNVSRVGPIALARLAFPTVTGLGKFYSP